MEKVTKKYVNRLVYGREWEQTEVELENPELIDTKDITSFYFSEQSFIVDGEDIYTGKVKETSPKYCVGSRISIIDAIAMCSNDPQTVAYLQKLQSEKPTASICKSDFGHLFVMYEGDITLEEYKNTKQNQI